jgi:hypothetical protein
MQLLVSALRVLFVSTANKLPPLHTHEHYSLNFLCREFAHDYCASGALQVKDALFFALLLTILLLSLLTA